MSWAQSVTGAEGQAGYLLCVSVPELFIQAQDGVRIEKAVLFLESKH